MADHGQSSDGTGATNGTGATRRAGSHYLGVGCFSVIAGFAGGGMISVLIAKIVGAATKCPAEAETGAPCNWFMFWFFGAIVGAVLLPVVTIALLRRGRRRSNNSQRG
jgi:hypothetical protein